LSAENSKTRKDPKKGYSCPVENPGRLNTFSVKHCKKAYIMNILVQILNR
jgi:hypothetical protein